MIMFACWRSKWKSPCVSLTCEVVFSLIFCRSYRYSYSVLKSFLSKVAKWCNALNESEFFFSVYKKNVWRTTHLCAVCTAKSSQNNISCGKKKTSNKVETTFIADEIKKNKICSLLIWNLFWNLFKVHLPTNYIESVMRSIHQSFE